MEDIVLESVWVAVSFVIFVALVWKRASKAFAEMLDQRTARIRTELDEARSLRDEALAELEVLEKRKAEAVVDVREILENARDTAERIRENAEIDAQETIRRREDQAKAKIKAAEEAIIGDLRASAARLASASAAKIITSRMGGKAGLEMIDESASEIEKLK